LPSSSTTPAAASIVSSEALTAMTLSARSPQNVESKDSARGGPPFKAYVYIIVTLQSINGKRQWNAKKGLS